MSFKKKFRYALACFTLPALLALAACGGGGSESTTSAGGSGSGTSTSSGSGSSSWGGGSGSGSAKYYRRTNNETALALDGSNSYFCSWGDCPGGATCGVKIEGVEHGSQVDWQIPTTANGGNKVKTTFDIVRNGTNVTLMYQGSRAGDYVPVSSWQEAARGDSGYCGGSGGSGSGSSTGGGSSGSGTTGQIAVYTRRSSLPASIAVTIDGQGVGSLTQYFNATPTCGDAGTITRTLSAGSHTISAKAGTLSWGPGSFTIAAGTCLTYELQ